MRVASLCSPGPHAFLLVIPVYLSFTASYSRAVRCLMGLFGKRVWRHTVVLFTWGEALGENVEQHIMRSEGLRRLVERGGNRYHILNSRRNATQVSQLLEKVEGMVAANQGGFYSSDVSESEEEEEKEDEEEEEELREKGRRPSQVWLSSKQKAHFTSSGTPEQGGQLEKEKEGMRENCKDRDEKTKRQMVGVEEKDRETREEEGQREASLSLGTPPEFWEGGAGEMERLREECRERKRENESLSCKLKQLNDMAPMLIALVSQVKQQYEQKMRETDGYRRIAKNLREFSAQATEALRVSDQEEEEVDEEENGALLGNPPAGTQTPPWHKRLPCSLL